MPHATTLPAVEVVGDVRAEVERAGLRVGAGRVVIVGGAVAERAAAARTAVADGRNVFIAWPPGSIADAEALVALADESGVEVGVERPLAMPESASGVSARVLSVRVSAREPAWPRLIAGVLDVCAQVAGTRGAARLDAEAERVGTELQAVAVALRFRNGAFAHALVRTGDPDEATLYASGTDRSWPLASAFGTEALTFVQAVADGRAPYALHEALATMRLAERVMAALR